MLILMRGKMDLKNNIKKHISELELSVATSKAYLSNFNFNEEIIKQTKRDIFLLKKEIHNLKDILKSSEREME